MRATALEPPPPTPTTLILVPSRASSWMANFSASIQILLMFGRRSTVNHRDRLFLGAVEPRTSKAVHRNNNPIKPGVLRLLSRFVFNRAEYLAKPAAVVQTG